MRLPNFFIVGAAKAGTTSLWRYLLQHPDIFMPSDIMYKEPAYFSNKKGIDSIDDYTDLFSGVKTEKMIGEASTAYLTSPESPERIKSLIPDAKIIVMLRNPIDRAYSLYNWMASNGYEPAESFESALDLEQSHRWESETFKNNNPEYYYNYLYFSSGLYYEQIRRYLDLFNRERVCFIIFEKFKVHFKEEVKKVFGYLAVDESFVPNFKIHNSGNIPYSAQLQFFIRQELYKYLKPPYEVPHPLRNQVIAKLMKLNTQSVRPKPLAGFIRNELKEKYKDDIKKTSEMIGEDLRQWWTDFQEIPKIENLTSASPAPHTTPVCHTGLNCSVQNNTKVDTNISLLDQPVCIDDLIDDEAGISETGPENHFSGNREKPVDTAPASFVGSKLSAHSYKVVHLCSNDSGGAGKAAYRLHKGLENAGLKSKMVVMNKKTGDPTVKIIPTDHADAIQDCIDLPVFESPLWLEQTRRWHNELKRYSHRPLGLETFSDPHSGLKLTNIREIREADIINLHWVAGLLDYTNLPQISQGKSVIWTLHDMNPFTGGCHYSGNCNKFRERCGACPQLGSNIEGDLSRRIWDLKYDAFKNVDIEIVTPSQWLADCVSRSSLFNKFHVRVIPNGLPLDKFKPNPKAEIREVLKIPESARVILFGAETLGNRRKGFKYLLDALKQMTDKDGKQTILLTFGDVSECRKIQFKFPIFNLGMVSNEVQLSLAYSAADVFVIPSLEDNLPNTAIEAMACGIPVVGFNVGGLSDIIDHRRTGYIAKPKDIKDLCEGIEWVVSQEENKAKMSDACRDKAETTFSVESQSARYRSLYAQKRQLNFNLIDEDAQNLNKTEKLDKNDDGEINDYLFKYIKTVDLGQEPYDISKLNHLRLFLNKAIERDIDNAEVRQAVLKIGEAYKHHNDKVSAKEIYLAYLNERPDDELIFRAWSHLGDSKDEKEIVDIQKAKKKKYLVSAIVSTYNSEEYIEECINNILSQSISDKIEIVVVNADSEQDEEKHVREFQAQSDNITYIRTRKRIGIYAAWNLGVREATGKYIISASTNDSLRYDTCEVLSDYLNKHPDCMLVYGDTLLTQTPHQHFEGNTHEDKYEWPPYSYRHHLVECLVGPHPMWRKSIHSEIGYFSENYTTVGDQEFWLRIGEKYNISHIPVFTGLQWITDSAISRKGPLPELEIKHIQQTYRKRFASRNTKHKVAVSIIIPVFNQLNYTKQCIEALYKHTPQSIFELIIVDNNSTDGTDRYLNSLDGNIRVVKNDKNLGFAVACNQGAHIANGEYVLFLNNDTEVLPNWLETMMEIADNDPSVAAVGSKLLFPDRTIQHAGVVVIGNKKISDPLNPIHIYYGQKEDFTEANKPRCYQVLTGACLLIRRKQFETVGGLDEQYWNGYEDVDLCFKLQRKGWKLIYQPKSVVIHHESKSGMERFSKTQQNIDLLQQKWVGKITPDLIIEEDGTIRATKAHRVQEYEIICKRHNLQHMELEKEQDIKVSIIILTLNQMEYTRKCIESIDSQTHIPHEIIVVDNGSTDETLAYLHSLEKKNRHRKGMTIVANKENLGFAGGNNVGLGLSKGTYVLMMNNDIVVTPGWLDLLIATAEKSPKIGIVGPKSNQVSGPQFVEKVHYNQETLEGLDRFSERFAKDNSGKSNRTLRVVGFCMLVKRAVIDRIGGMDDRFGRGNFEDDDFSIRAALAGFESWTVEDCFVHHFGNRTFIGEKIDYNESLSKNWEIFKEKWGLPSSLEYGSPYSISQMNIAGFDSRMHYIPIPNNAGKDNLQKKAQFSAAEQEYRKICSGIEPVDLNYAIDRLQGFVSRFTNFAVAYNDLGVLLYQKGDKEGALENYQKAVSLDPRNITLKKNLADFLYVECGMVEKALNIYVDILSTNPADVETLLITGHICVAQEQFEDAASFYEKVIEIEPNNFDACQHLEILKKRLSLSSEKSSLTDAATDASDVENKPIPHEFPSTGMNGEKAIERPLVCFIMVLEGPFDAMQKSYASLRENTKVTYELFFMENGAGAKVKKWAQKTVNNDKYQRSFYIVCGESIAEKFYHAIELARGEYVVIIRDNILVSEHWLTDMINTSRLSKNAGIIGLFTTYNSGNNKLDATINEKNYPEYARKFRVRNRHRRIPVRLIDSPCLIFKRELADAITKGDIHNTDIKALLQVFCQRVSEAGFQNMIAGDVLVHHLNYGAKLVGVTDKKKNGGRNQEPFHEKWNGLMTDYSHVGQSEIRALLEKADRLFQKGLVEKGIEVLLEGISSFPEDDCVYITLAEQLFNSGRYQDALDALAEIPVDASKEEKAGTDEKGKIRLLKAYCEEGLGNYESAAGLVDQVLRCHPDNPKALNIEGVLAYRNNEKHRARDRFQRAIDADPGYGEPHTNLGSLLWESGDTHEALDLFERGFILTPTDTDVATAYHEAVSALKEFSRAEQTIREALTPYPYNRKIRYMLIDVLIQMGKMIEALSQIEMAMSICGLEYGVLDAALSIRKQIGSVEITKKIKNKSSVSLCMIVKNEEEFLPQCLASVRPIVDEMIIVDTGSEDRTKDIAAVFGAQVFDFEWNGDFAEARNFSLTKADGDWILIMDADEKISPQDYKRFRKLVGKKSYGLVAYSIITRNYCNMANTIGWIPNSGQYASEEAGLGWLSSEKVRLFSNNRQFKFVGAVHEMVDPVLKRHSVDIKKCPIPVHHYGRLNTDKLARKDQAYYEIGLKKLKENGGGDIGAVRELAIQATVLQRNSEAVDLWEKFLSLQPRDEAVADAYLNMVSVYIRMQEYGTALELARKAVSLKPQLKEAHYNLGITELYSGNAEAAFNTFKKLAKNHPGFPPAQFMLTASNHCRNGSADASINFRQLKRSAFGPVLTYSVTELAEGLMAAGQPLFAFGLLKKTIEEKIVSKTIMKLYAECVVKVKEVDSNAHNQVLGL